jgi:undecaprenyl phosphate-alpha-L-ara4FN deformylase
MKIGLKIDVDTFRGTRLGVLSIARELAKRGRRATFYFSVGPDNMGRHLWRLLKPAFLLKMLRSDAPGLYGWDILLKGTLWPGPLIGRACAAVIRETAQMGHEIGLHAWDHHAWQARSISGGEPFVREQLRLGVETLTEILGAPPATSAAPGWRADENTLAAKQKFSFRYNSDCRGASIFRPLVRGTPSPQPQIPTTLPTYDELIGRDGITRENYNARLAEQFRPGALNVLCIHAESEGVLCFDLFRDFCERVEALGATFAPLSDLLPLNPAALPAAPMALALRTGREGRVAMQQGD